MNSKHILTAILTLTILIGCNKNTNKITDTKDYNSYLETKENKDLALANEEHKFWTEKLEKTPNQYPYLGKIAGANAQLFSTTGEINYLIEAEKKLILANERTNYNNAGYLRSLARNYISQHRFKEALEQLLKAETNGEKLTQTQQMLFDVYLELGNADKAKHYLNEVKDLSDFGYLIRLSKWSDHEGNLDAAIKYMEKAKEIAESSKNKVLMQWSYTNLGDYYGHANRIEDSYNMYLKTLAMNPNEAYAKKGIAWIVYSHERNPEEAMRILEAISAQHKSPDYYLLKAEIAEYQNDSEEKQQNIKAYMAAVQNKQYGDMYNKYNALLFAEELNQVDSAMQIAQKEIDNRPTPQSYDLLAWSYFHKGEAKKALEIVEQHIANKTFEPEAQYHMAAIYKANGMGEDAKKLKKELLESAYELGPVLEQNIKNL
ncbi:cell surface protein [Aureibaculum sp. 2210JD6-5]|uniref:tetratricopeptide repeat protein n=1 Tax=Aureibaculum sp. 2210JD6-5 TaxID=3103957 RepID=UPI002AAE2700|nr:cell surface protein [Aureibaculum sp. 2210JD6-5]MDY7395278.1 cell surface protein [Aureibaculum sp. 2210JD6-5]